MKVLKFSTNLKCEGCVAAAKPFLDRAKSIESWQIDLESKEKMLEVSGEAPDASEIISLMADAGYEVKEKSGFFRKVFG